MTPTRIVAHKDTDGQCSSTLYQEAEGIKEPIYCPAEFGQMGSNLRQARSTKQDRPPEPDMLRPPPDQPENSTLQKNLLQRTHIGRRTPQTLERPRPRQMVDRMRRSIRRQIRRLAQNSIPKDSPRKNLQKIPRTQNSTVVLPQIGKKNKRNRRNMENRPLNGIQTQPSKLHLDPPQRRVQNRLLQRSQRGTGILDTENRNRRNETVRRPNNIHPQQVGRQTL